MNFNDVIIFFSNFAIKRIQKYDGELTFMKYSEFYVLC